MEGWMSKPAMSQIDTPFPHAPRRDLTDPPIELILAQVRFPTLAELFSNEGFVRFATAMRGDYPKATPLHELEKLELSGGRVNALSGTPVWKLEDLDGLWTLTLTPEFLALEVKQYQRFSEFKKRFQSAWKCLVDLYEIRNRTRLGLRYVDRFASGKQKLPSDWMSLLSKSIFPLRERDLSLSQAGQLVHYYSIGENLSLTYRSAFKWGGSSSATQNEVILDLDCFDPQTASTTDVSSRLEDLKEVTHNAFWWTFETLIDVLDPTNAT